MPLRITTALAAIFKVCNQELTSVPRSEQTFLVSGYVDPWAKGHYAEFIHR